MHSKLDDIAPDKRWPARRVAVYQGLMPLHQSAIVGRDAAPLLFNVVLARTIPRRPRAPGSALLKAEAPKRTRLGVLLFYSRASIAAGRHSAYLKTK
jgi:hypothetical protein